MTAHPPTAHTYSPASAPSASTPALPVDEPDDLSGPGGSAEAGAGERLIDRIERSDILRITVVGLAVLGAWVAGATGTPRWAVGAVGAAALLLAARRRGGRRPARAAHEHGAVDAPGHRRGGSDR